MLKMSDAEIESVLPIFSSKGVDVAFIVPTATGMGKSILDATATVRQFLHRNAMHDYSAQAQGQENKVSLPAYFVYAGKTEETKVTLYRPRTKSGDPRLWFYGLGKYCSPFNLLGIVTDGCALYVINLSVRGTVDAAKHGGAPSKLLDRIAAIAHAASAELLAKLREIHKMGFVDTVARGDTGVGMTLEALLGIAANSNAAPDYKGIELKATRKKIGTSSKVTLFSQVPNWSRSKMSANEILQSFGYPKDGILQLYCTVSANNPNPQGLYFVVDDNADVLLNKHFATKTGNVRDVALWEMDRMRSSLSTKHKETFWVSVSSRIKDGIEQFCYEYALHTHKPNVHLLAVLLERGIVTMEYTLKQANSRAKDHGYIFKIKSKNIDFLFPNPVAYILGEQ